MPTHALDDEASTVARTAPPAVSLLLCTLGRTAPLERALRHLARQSLDLFEIVIVDQNADDRLDAVLLPFGDMLRIVHVRASPGLSHARNVGLAVCRGEIIGFPDDDCWYPQTLVADVVTRFAAHPAAAAIMGRTLDADGRDSLGRFLGVDQAVDKHNLWFAGNSNSLFVRASAAHAAGGFDETLGVGAPTIFKSGEETDFVLRLLAPGRQVLFQRDLVVHHDQVGDNAGAAGLRRAKAYAPGFGRVLRMHDYGLPYVGLRVLRTLGAALFATVRGDIGDVRYRLAWAHGTIRGYVASRP